MADPGADTSSGGYGDPDDGYGGDYGGNDVNTGFDFADNAVGRSIMDVIGGPAERGWTEIDSATGRAINPAVRMRSGLYLEPTVKNYVKSMIPNIMAQAKNVKDLWGRYDETAKAMVAEGYFPDITSAKSAISQVAAEDREAIANNVTHGDMGRDDIVNMVDQIAAGDQTAETAQAPAYDPTASIATPVSDEYYNQYNAGQGETMNNDDIWGMYNKGYDDLTAAEKAALADIDRALTQGRGDITGYGNQATGYYAPYREAGTNALSALQSKMASGPGDFYTSPGYDWRVKQGINAMEAAASARGGTGALYDPRMYKELTEYGQNMATEEYDKFLDRYYKSMEPYQWMTGSVGLPAAGASADIAYNTGQSLANLGMTGAQQNALTRQNMATQRTNLGTATTGNLLAKEGLGIDWGRLKLAESEGAANRQWTTSENELNRALAREAAEKGYNFYDRMNTQNQQNTLWNSLIQGGGYLLGKW